MTKFEKILLTISIISLILWCVLSADNDFAYYCLSVGFISLAIFSGSIGINSNGNIFDNQKNININITINDSDKDKKDKDKKD